jgi:putative membrane protein
MKRSIVCAFLLLFVFTTPAWTHEGEPLRPHDLLTAWTFDPGIVIPLILSAALYLRGVRRSPVRRSREIQAYTAGWIFLAIALVSPIHPLGEVLLSVHMAQHTILMLVAAPLLVLGRPMAPYLFALPVSSRHRLVAFSKRTGVRNSWHFITTPFVACALSGIALWIWHAPALYQQTLESDLVHSAQHLTFLFTSLLFWWSIIHGRRSRAAYGESVAYLFATAIHTSVLGALLTIAQSPWYPAYVERAEAWGLTPLQDQQLAGLVMWVPCGLIYLIAGLVLFALWLRESEPIVFRYEIRRRLSSDRIR